MKEQLLAKLRLQKEIAFCEDDPIYFMSMYVNVAHSTHGSMLFLPHPHQEDYINALPKGNTIVRAARAAGSSVTTTLYMFWEGFFRKKLQVFTSHKIYDAADNLQRIRHAYMTMPVWMRDSNPMVVNTKMAIEFANGSRFLAVGATESAYRGMAVDTLFLDAFSRIQNQEDLLTTAMPGLYANDSKIIIVSSDDESVLFNDMFSDAQKGYGTFTAVRLVPDY